MDEKSLKMYLYKHKKAMFYRISFTQSYKLQGQMKTPATIENGSLLTTIPGNTRIIMKINKNNII